jgi:hypothetical protein
LSAGQPIRVRLLSGYLPSIGKRPFYRDDLFPRSHAAYGPLDVLRPKAEGGGFFGEMVDEKNALSRSSTSGLTKPIKGFPNDKIAVWGHEGRGLIMDNQHQQFKSACKFLEDYEMRICAKKLWSYPNSG